MNEPEPEPAGLPQGKFMMVAAWVSALALLVLIFGRWEKQTINPNQNPASRINAGIHEVVLKGNRAAHYLVNGKINSKEVTFLLDTGATHVAIPQKLADKLGLAPLNGGYADTANGRVRVDFTRIDSLEIGPIKLYDVSSTINKNMPDDLILLGMSALKQLELVQADNQLILRQGRP